MNHHQSKGVDKIKPYIPGKTLEEVAQEYGLEYKNLVKMASNENPLSPSSSVQKAIIDSLPELNRYPDGSARTVRDVIAKKYGVKPESVIVGNGIEDLLIMIGMAFLDDNKHAIAAYPSFILYYIVAQMMNSECITVPLNDEYCHDLKKIAQLITEQTNIIFICNPNNPTGTIVNKKEMDLFLRSIPGDVIVVLDEAYIDYVDSEDFPDGIYYLENYNVIILRTISKAHGLAGLRMGYAIAAPSLIEILFKVKQPFNVNSIAKTASMVALNDKDYLNNSFESNKKGKNYLYKELSALGLDYVPSQTNFILITIGNDADECFKSLQKKGVIVRPGAIFNYPDAIRVTVGTMEQNKRFVEELKEYLGKC